MRAPGRVLSSVVTRAPLFFSVTRSSKRSMAAMVASSPEAVGICSACAGAPVGGSSVTDVASVLLEHWSADVVRWHKLPRGGYVLALTLPISRDIGSAGRPFVNVELQKAMESTTAPFWCTAFVTQSPLAPESIAAVLGGSYATPQVDVQPASLSAAHSADIMRSVPSYLSDRASSSSIPGGTSPDEQGAVSDELLLQVRSASRPLTRNGRIDFTSLHELSSKAELIERWPGRMTIFWAGVEPRAEVGVVAL